MEVGSLTERQREFLKSILEVEEIEDIESLIRSRGYSLYQCVSCGRRILHDGYEFWNLTDCCDDNSKLVNNGVICEACYSKSFENLKDWILFKPTWMKDVEFRLGAKDASFKKHRGS